MQSLSDINERVFESNVGIVQVSCPWCVHKHPFGVELIVVEKSIPEMFYAIKHAYERVLFLRGWDSKRIAEETKLRQSVIVKSRTIAAPAKPVPLACEGEIAGSKVESCPCESDSHCGV
jgi:hypothetical protein